MDEAPPPGASSIKMYSNHFWKNNLVDFYQEFDYYQIRKNIKKVF